VITHAPEFGPLNFDNWLGTELQRLLGHLAESAPAAMWQPTSRDGTRLAAGGLVAPSLRLAVGAAVLACTCGGLALAYHADELPSPSNSSLSQRLSANPGPSAARGTAQHLAKAPGQTSGRPAATPGRRGAGHLRQPGAPAARGLGNKAERTAPALARGRGPGASKPARSGGAPSPQRSMTPTPADSGRDPKSNSQEFKP